MKIFTAAVFLAVAVSSVSAFSPPAAALASISGRTALAATSTTTTAENDGVASSTPSLTVPMPQSYSEMVRQMSSAMSDAVALGRNHQMIRVCLPRSADNANLGVFSEGLLDVDSADIMLVPPDESWQGGIMQLYYSAFPTMSDALRLFTENGSGVPPRIEEDRSVDESGVDGVSVLTADAGDGTTIKCFIQPSQETVDEYVDAVARRPGMVVLINPQWRVTDDWFDGVSKTDEGFFGKVAQFLGGKGGTLRRLGELEFEAVYNLEGYVCRGWNIRMVKRFDSDYTVYVDSEKGTYKQVGTKTDRPNYQEVENMLDEAGFKVKFTAGLI